MLFTRCPECDTTFRITKEALEKAQGRVRCGRCSNIFDAHEELREQLESADASEWKSPPAAEALATETSQEPTHIVLETAPDEPESSGDVEETEKTAPALWLLESVDDVPDARSSRGWLVAATAAALVLCGQIVHHFRDNLATQPVVGAWIASAYSVFGVQLAPRWDVRQYRILQSDVATEPGATGRGNLVIHSRILNDGPRAQPMPFVRLSLLDLREKPIASRVFKPNEYSPAPIVPMLDAGAAAEARFVVVDPGPDAYSYELDVCIQARNRYECENDTVFD